jgi:hypothetical protein
MRIAAGAMAGWMALFAAVHAYWLLGGRAGLPRHESLWSRPALVVIDIIAIPLCLAGVALARSLGRPGAGRLSPRNRLRLVAPTAAVLVIHVLPTVPTWVRLALPDPPALSADERFVAFLYEPFFLTGGVLCAAAALAYRRLTVE